MVCDRDPICDLVGMVVRWCAGGSRAVAQVYASRASRGVARCRNEFLLKPADFLWHSAYNLYATGASDRRKSSISSTCGAIFDTLASKFCLRPRFILRRVICSTFET